MLLPFVIQGAGAFEVAARQYLVNEVKKTVKGVINIRSALCRKVFLSNHAMSLNIGIYELGTACATWC